MDTEACSILHSHQKCKTGKRHAINHALPGFAGLSKKEGKMESESRKGDPCLAWLPSGQRYAINHTAASLVLFVRGEKGGGS